MESTAILPTLTTLPTVTEDIIIPSDNLREESVFSINRWFNELPIRIIGTPDMPFFYAQDLATVLGIKQVTTSIRTFVKGKDIVTSEMRAKYDLVTYQNHGNIQRINDTVTLLTEQGAYKLIMNSRSKVASQFQDFVYNIIRDIRLREQERLKIEIGKLTTKVRKYKSRCIVTYILKKRINGDPYTVIPCEELDKDSHERFGYVWDGTYVKNLYKLLITKPTASDRSEYMMYAKIQDRKKKFFNDIETDINITKELNLYCKYLIRKPDLSDVDESDIEYT